MMWFFLAQATILCVLGVVSSFFHNNNRLSSSQTFHNINKVSPGSNNKYLSIQAQRPTTAQPTEYSTSALSVYHQQLEHLVSSWKYLSTFEILKDMELKTVDFTIQLYEHLKFCQNVNIGRDTIVSKIAGNLVLAKNINNIKKKSVLVADSDEVVIEDTLKFVQAMIADFGACPFTTDSKRAGPSKGPVKYIVSHATTLEDAFYDYWKEAILLEEKGEKDISTTILIFSDENLFTNNIERYELYCECLEQILDESPENYIDFTFQGSNQLDNVYFHPDFKFKDKDGQVVFLFDEDDNIIGTSDQIITAGSYARRSPYPIINILRAPMVKAGAYKLVE